MLFEVLEDDMVGNNEDEAGAVTDDTVSAGGRACWVRVDELRPVAKEVGRKSMRDIHHRPRSPINLGAKT